MRQPRKNDIVCSSVYTSEPGERGECNMKILALVFAARRDETSKTLQMTKELCGMIGRRCEDAAFEILTMSELPVQACVGCKTCFLEGFCPQDGEDGMAELRRKVIDCDALIAATPVYMCSVSGWCKIFLDRCARWCHVFELLGKPGLVLSVTGASGAERAADYLSECLEVMGCAVAARLPLQKLGEGLVIGGEEARTAMESAAEALLDAVEHPEQYLSERAETQFRGIRQNYRSLETFRLLMGQSCSDEINTFRERGLMGCASLREALQKKGKTES